MSSDQDSNSGSESEDIPVPEPVVQRWRPPPMVPDVDYIPGPLKCPGECNLMRAKGPIVKKFVYAIPLTEDDIHGFLDIYYPEPIDPSESDINKSMLIFDKFPGRPEGTQRIVTLEIPLIGRGHWLTFACIIGDNYTQERIQKAEDSGDVVLKLQKYFNTDRAPGWYRFRRV